MGRGQTKEDYSTLITIDSSIKLESAKVEEKEEQVSKEEKKIDKKLNSSPSSKDQLID